MELIEHDEPRLFENTQIEHMPRPYMHLFYCIANVYVETAYSIRYG